MQFQQQDGICKEMIHGDYPTRLLYLPHGTGRLEKLGFHKAFPKEQLIAEQGSFTDYCYIVKKGRVIAFEFTSTGEERVYNFMEEGSLLLEANLLFHKQVSVNFKTAVESDLVCVSRDALLHGMAVDQQITLDVMESVTNKFFASMDQIRQECYHNVEWKICNLLLIFAERFGVPFGDKTLITEKISQQMISNLLGINRITTVRIIKELKERNLIEKNKGYYSIRSLETLEQHMIDILFTKR